MGKTTFRPMTSLEARAASALGNARFAPATSAKRIAHKIASQVSDMKISDKQACVLWSLCWTYRRSINDVEVLEVAKRVRDGAKPPLPQEDLPW